MASPLMRKRFPRTREPAASKESGSNPRWGREEQNVRGPASPPEQPVGPKRHWPDARLALPIREQGAATGAMSVGFGSQRALRSLGWQAVTCQAPSRSRPLPHGRPTTVRSSIMQSLHAEFVRRLAAGEHLPRAQGPHAAHGNSGQCHCSSLARMKNRSASRFLQIPAPCSVDSLNVYFRLMA
jgi:hypothetical protein